MRPPVLHNNAGVAGTRSEVARGGAARGAEATLMLAMHSAPAAERGAMATERLSMRQIREDIQHERQPEAVTPSVVPVNVT